MKRLPKAQSRLCPDSQISSAIIPAQSPAAHNQPHETGAWVVAHALGLETDPTDRWVFSVHWVDFIMKTFLGILAFINHVWKGIVCHWHANISGTTQRKLWSTKYNSMSWRARQKDVERVFPKEILTSLQQLIAFPLVWNFSVPPGDHQFVLFVWSLHRAVRLCIKRIGLQFE